METETLEGDFLDAPATERPSEQFLRAVAGLLGTDADDLLSEMGYVSAEAVVLEEECAAV